MPAKRCFEEHFEGRDDARFLDRIDHEWPGCFPFVDAHRTSSGIPAWKMGPRAMGRIPDNRTTVIVNRARFWVVGYFDFSGGASADEALVAVVVWVSVTGVP